MKTRNGFVSNSSSSSFVIIDATQGYSDFKPTQLVLGEEGGCGKGCCASDVELQIRRDDARDAQRIIDLDFETMTGISDFGHNIADSVYDPSAQTSICPACGFSFSAADHTCPDCGLCFG